MTDEGSLSGTDCHFLRDCILLVDPFPRLATTRMMNDNADGDDVDLDSASKTSLKLRSYT